MSRASPGERPGSAAPPRVLLLYRPSRCSRKPRTLGICADAFPRDAGHFDGQGSCGVEHAVRQTQQAYREGRLARARGAPRDANPHRSSADATPGTQPPAHKLTAEKSLAMRLESAWRIGWEAVDRELSHAPAQASDSRRRLDRA